MKKLINKILLPILLIGISQFALASGEAGKNEALVHSYEKVGTTFLIGLFLMIAGMFTLAAFQYYFQQLRDGKTSEEVLGFSFTRTEYDKDELTDHKYDGIQELDNRMPPWLKYMFIFTISFAIFYVMHYMVLQTGDLQLAEYQKELATAEREISEFQLKSASFVDENTAKPSSDAAMLGKGNEIFKKNCTVCHGQAGEGGVGPNLSDEYWINGGDFKSIFKTIKHGVTEKGMKSWKQDLSAAQILQVSSYVRSLKGTVQGGKEKQGVIYSGAE